MGIVISSYLDDDPNANIVLNRTIHGYVLILIHYMLEDMWFLEAYENYINTKESIPYEIREIKIPIRYSKGLLFDIHLSYNWPGTPFKCIR